ncbi:LysM peptidoglycan-binding domain-containing protein [Candidatus Dependentiae bacterium]|nr:LysM peptidoglycan-binding domain-containing protein [Candidatus Dependentiae bacterium]
MSMKKYFLNIIIIILICKSGLVSEDKLKEVTVKSGDTLWSISQEYLKDPLKWNSLSKYNNLENPDVLIPGMKIKIPEGELKAEETGKNPRTEKVSVKPASKTKISKSKSKSKKEIKIVEPPKIVIEEKIVEESKIEKDLRQFENEFNELLAKDSMIKNQREYFQIIKTLDDIKKEIALNNKDVAAELFEKVKILAEKLKINVQVETIILKKVKLVQIKGRVDLYNAKDYMWTPASANIDKILNSGDKIRTGALSNAVITFEDGSSISVRSNSEIEIKRCVYDIRNNTLYSKALLLRGSINYKTRDGLPVKVVNEVECLDSLMEFNGALTASLLIDGTIKYELYYGSGNLMSRSERIGIPNGNGVYIFPGAAPSKPEKLLEPVLLSSPINNVYSKTSVPELLWQPLKGADYYLVQIAEDEMFNKLVFEETVKNSKVKSSALLDGKYFWRIIPIDKNGFNGFSGEYRTFIIDTISPRLTIISPIDDEITNEKYVKIHGFTEPGKNITINRFSIIPDKNGEFRTNVPMNQGTNVIMIETVDEAGNVNKVYKTVHVDYDMQLVCLNNIVYSTIPNWAIHTYNVRGEAVFNNEILDVKYGEWSRDLTLDRGRNVITLSLDGVGYKEIPIIYDNSKPVLKSLRITPDFQGDQAVLTVTLIAVDANSPLSKNAKVILIDKDNTGRKFQADLVYNSKTNEYYGKIIGDPQILKSELILAYVSVSDIVGNTVYLNEETIEIPGQPTLFWDKVKTNYKQLGLPVFILSAGGILFSL